MDDGLIQSGGPAEPPGPLPPRRASVFHPDFSSLFLDPNAVMPEQLTTSRPSKDSGNAGNVATQSPHHRFPPVGEVPGKPGNVLDRDHPQPGTGETAAGLEWFTMRPCLFYLVGRFLMSGNVLCSAWPPAAGSLDPLASTDILCELPSSEMGSRVAQAE